MKMSWHAVWRTTDAAVAPFVHEVVDCGDVAELTKIATEDYNSPRAVIVIASAREMRTQQDAVRTIATTFGFPARRVDATIRNLKYPLGWYAMRDLLQELDRSKFEKLIFVITEAEQFLIDDTKMLPHLEGTFADVGRYWATEIQDGSVFAHEAKSFHTVFAYSDRAAMKVRKTGRGKTRID
jgi:hypothetical protein